MDSPLGLHLRPGSVESAVDLVVHVLVEVVATFPEDKMLLLQQGGIGAVIACVCLPHLEHLRLFGGHDEGPGVLLFGLSNDDPTCGSDGHCVEALGMVIGVLEPGQALADGGLLREFLDYVFCHNLVVHLIVHDAHEL